MTETSIADVGNESARGFGVSFACVVYVIGYAGYYLGDPLRSIRYLTYAAPLLLVASFLLQERASTSNRSAVAFFLAYMVLGLVSCLAGTFDGEFVARNFIIIALIIASFIPSIEVSLAHIRFIFLCSLVYLLLAYGLAERGDLRLLVMLQNGAGSAAGDMGYDNNEGGGLVCPLYAVFLYATGAKRYFVLALIMSVVGGKRVAVLAILVGISAALLLRNIRALNQRHTCFLALLAALAIINIVATHLTSISENVYQSLDTSVSIDEVMLGRYAIAAEMDRMTNTRPFVESLFGSGPGSGDGLASVVSSGVLTQPHNDWMRILYDYGIAGSLVMTTFMALLFSTSGTGAVIAIVTAVMMCTDNVLIYLYYFFPAVLMVAYSATQESASRKTVREASR